MKPYLLFLQEKLERPLTTASERSKMVKYENRIRSAAGGGMSLSQSSASLPHNHSTSNPNGKKK